MGRPKGSTDTAPVIRRAFMGAVKRLEKSKTSLSFLIEQSLKEDVKGTLKAIASFNPRQVNVDQKQTIEIQDIISIVDQRRKEKLIDHEPLEIEPLEASTIDQPIQTGQVDEKEPDKKL